jgi:hypothetical protein
MDPSLKDIKGKLLDLLKMPSTITQNTIPRIETLVLPRSAEPDKYCVNHFSAELLEAGVNSLSTIINLSIPKIDAVFKNYQRYEFLLQNDPCNYLDNESSLPDFEEPVEALHEARDEVETISESFMYIGPFILDCSLVKSMYLHYITAAIARISTILASKISLACSQMLKVYEDLNLKLMFDPGVDHKLWKQLESGLQFSEVEFVNFNEQVIVLTSLKP